MNLKQRYKINIPKIIHETIDDEVLIIEFDSGNYYSLREIGAIIWEGIVKGANANEINAAISEHYDISLDEIKSSVAQLISELEFENIITPLPPEEKVKDFDSLDLFFPQKEVSNSFYYPKLEKYTDMQELLLLDPIHDVDELGWPAIKSETSNDN